MNTVIVNHGPFDGDPEGVLYFWNAGIEDWLPDIKGATRYTEADALRTIQCLDPCSYTLKVGEELKLTEPHSAIKNYLILRLLLQFDFETVKDQMNLRRVNKITTSELLKISNALLNKAFHEGTAKAHHLHATYDSSSGELSLAYVPVTASVTANPNARL